MKFYSPSKKSFFDGDIHKNMPQDAVQVADSEWAKAVDLRSRGLSFTFKNGFFTPGEKIFANAIGIDASKVRQQLIDATDPLAIRHMRQELRFTAAEMEALAKKGKALTTSQFKELEAYTQALRDLPTTLKTWPKVADGDWPKKPTFMDKSSTTGA